MQVVACHIKLLCIIACLMPQKNFCTGTDPALERRITLSLHNEKVAAALEKIQDQARITFAYRPAIFSNATAVTVNLVERTVREALAIILPGTITYTAKNNYIILKEKKVAGASKKTEVSGYIIDKTTDQKVPNVSIYNPKTLESVTSDEYGYYSIRVPEGDTLLAVNRTNYDDTAISVAAVPQGSILNIGIFPRSDSVKADWRAKLNGLGEQTNLAFRRFSAYVNTINIRDTLNREFQFSFLPFVGTNHALSGNVYNKYSVNALGGYSRGVKRLEIGGLFNIVRENVTGVQAGGLFNIAGDTVQGLQAAGLFNLSGRHVEGVQSAGLINSNLGTLKGVQAAGLVNINRKSLEGVQAAGLVNICDAKSKGFMAAGLLNSAKSCEGFALAGLVNAVADTMSGPMLAGLINVSRYSADGVQVAGLINVTAGGSVALQVAGLINIAMHVEGLQLGLLNFADTASGVPFGFFSFVRKGIHQVEFSGDEIMPMNVSFRSGVPAVYNIFSAGINPGGKKQTWQFGYGLGTSFCIGGRLRSDLSVTGHHLSKGDFYFETSELYRLYWGIEYRIGRKVTIAGGPVYNLYLSDTRGSMYESDYSGIAPYHFFDSTGSEGYNAKSWVGGRLAIRFL
jgi:hypothetical protein